MIIIFFYLKGKKKEEPFCKGSSNTAYPWCFFIIFTAGFAAKMLMAFSVYTNGAKLLSTERTAGSLECVHGIRFLSMTWVVLGHTFLLPLAVACKESPCLLVVFLSFISITAVIVILLISSALWSGSTWAVLSMQGQGGWLDWKWGWVVWFCLHCGQLSEASLSVSVTLVTSSHEWWLFLACEDF